MPDWRPLLAIVGRQVKHEREARGMTQTALAERAGVRVGGDSARSSTDEATRPSRRSTTSCA